MESLLFLIPVALIIVVIAIRTLFWAVKSGQYDDLDTEGQRILFDNERIDHAPEPPADKTPEPASKGPTL
jgi:cbb3-type cytochrome oxidase maturation protein